MRSLILAACLLLLGHSASAASAPEAPRRVAILLFPGVQIIDYTGPYEVFGQAGFRVCTVAESTAPLQTAMGMTVTPDFSFADAPVADIIVLPGGDVPAKADRSHPALRWLLQAHPRAVCTLSVCNGAFWLANAGLLDGLEATTYYGLLGELRAGFPKVRVVADQRFCDNGRIVTTAGLSSGIDGALHTVERLLGRGKAQAVALNMEYRWEPDSTYARGAFADRFLRAGGRFQLRLGEPAEVKLLERRGDRERWDESWLVLSATANAGTLLGRVAAALPAGWKKSEEKKEGEARWSFADEQGVAWECVVKAREGGQGKGESGWIVSMTVQRVKTAEKGGS